MTEVERIVCAVDFDEASRHALDYAIALAARLGASLTVVHAYEIPVYPVSEDGMVELPVEVEADVEARVRARLEQFMASVDPRGVPLEWRLLEGQPDLSVCQFAERLPAELLVVGTHGRGGLTHLILGSTAERIVRRSRVPVLSVRG